MAQEDVLVELDMTQLSSWITFKAWLSLDGPIEPQWTSANQSKLLPVASSIRRDASRGVIILGA